MSMLEDIDISDNHVSGNIPPEMGKLLNLQDLRLHLNDFEGHIPQSIFNISALQIISLTVNHFSGSLPSSLGLGLPNLDALYLGGNQLGGEIPSSVSNASRLTEIDLSFNMFSGNVPMSLGNLPLLQFLNLESNQLTNDPSALQLDFITSLTSCTYLNTLIIGPNPLNSIIPKSVGNLFLSLQMFYAPASQIKGVIPSKIGNLSNLVELDLRENELTGTIPMTLGQLRNIQRLRISRTYIGGLIPGYFCNLTSLGELFLSANHFSGPVPSCLGNLTSLRSLSSDSNELTSHIPSSLWSLEDLNALDLSSNFLTGSLSPEIGNLKHIVQLNLSKNSFSGEIPSTIGQLQSLEALDLSHNKLQGPLLPSFSNLLNLESLNLSHNKLSGAIPKSLEKLLYLKYLNLSFNRLSGEIPSGGHFANFSADSFLQNAGLCGAAKYHVKACHSPRHSRKKEIALKYILPPIASAAIAAALLVGFIRSQHRRNKQLPPVQVDPPPGITHKMISYHEVVCATNNFSEDNLIGRGSLGLVYKGLFSDGMVAAVKVFDLELPGAFKSFETECQVISNIRHRNLVKVISSCSNLDFRALIMEYMPNGNLESWLYSHSSFLSFLQRLDIMIDVASALEYLHRGYSILVVHCDLKPSNVLLDENMTAHVGDFGITKLFTENKSITQTKTVGTVGFMAPEYGLAGLVSSMGDVYSYGILLMETFTRKKPTDDIFLGDLSLKRWVSESFPVAVMEIMDPNLLTEKNENLVPRQNCLSSLLELALECTNDSPDERINMTNVLIRLKKIKAAFHANLGSS